jgi:hypothetical protein
VLRKANKGKWQNYEKLHNNGLHKVHFSQNIIMVTKSEKKIWMSGTCSTLGAIIIIHKILLVKPEGKRKLDRPRRGRVVILQLPLKKQDINL